MALIKIESARVVRHVGTRGAFAVEEYVNLPDGRSFPKTYTVWNEGTAPEVDGIVAVVGELSTKVREYQLNGSTKYAVDVSVNQPTVTAIGVNKLDTVPQLKEAAAQAEQSSEVPF